MSMCQRKINMIIGKNPKLKSSFDRNKTILWLENIHIYLLITNKSI